MALAADRQVNLQCAMGLHSLHRFTVDDKRATSDASTVLSQLHQAKTDQRVQAFVRSTQHQRRWSRTRQSGIVPRQSQADGFGEMIQVEVYNRPTELRGVYGFSPSSTHT